MEAATMPLMTFVIFLLFLWSIGIALNQFSKQESTEKAS
ncbi:hypothetical protein N836_19885 [Leptolyngbya sp. Heron Island J]|nr:hypothetical protein N836_19885 [Leptolyngbya sp. Heron Island J]